MQQSLKNQIMSGGLIALSAIASTAKLDAQEPTLPPLPKESVKELSPEAQIIFELHKLSERASNELVDISDEINILSNKASKIWFNPYIRGAEFREVEEGLNKLAANCMSHFEQANEKELSIIVKNISTLTISFRWHERDIYPLIKEGTFKNQNIEKTLATATDSDTLNRARLNATVDILKHWHSCQAKEPIKAIFDYHKKLFTHPATSAETRAALLPSAKSTLIFTHNTFINTSDTWTTSCADLADIIATLLEEQPEDRDSLLLSATMFSQFSDINPELRYGSGKNYSPDFYRLVDTIEKRLEYVAKKIPQLESINDQQRIRHAMYRQMGAVSSMPAKTQDAFLEIICNTYLANQTKSPGVLLDLTSSIRTKSDSHPNLYITDWSSYALFKMLDVHKKPITKALTAIQVRALQAKTEKERKVALDELNEVGLFFDRLPIYQFSYSTLKFDDASQNTILEHRKKVIGWQQHAFGKAIVPFAKKLIEGNLNFTVNRRNAPESTGQLDTLQNLDNILLRAVHRDPTSGKAILGIIEKELPKTDEKQREALYTLLRAPIITSLIDRKEAINTIDFIRGRIATEQSPKTLRALGQSIAFGCNIECSKILFNLAEGQHLVDSGFTPYEIEQLFRSESDLLIELANTDSQVKPYREIKEKALENSTDYEQLLSDLLDVLHGSLASSNKFLQTKDFSSKEEQATALAHLRHNASLTLSATLIAQRHIKYRATLISKIEQSFATFGNSTELGERAGMLYELYNTHGQATLDESTKFIKERAEHMRSMLFDGQVELVQIEGEERRFNHPAVFDTIVNSLNDKTSPFVQGEDLKSDNEKRSKLHREKLYFAKGFLRTTEHLDDRERLLFLKELGFYFSDIEDVERNLKILQD